MQLKASIVMVLALGLVRDGTPGRQAGADSVSVQAVRFFRPDGTLINGFVRVPHQLLSPVTVGASGYGAFRLDVVTNKTPPYNLSFIIEISDETKHKGLSYIVLPRPHC